MTARLVLNVFAICAAAGFAGVMLSIGINLGLYWKSLPPADFLAWFGANSHFIGLTIPFMVVPTLLALLASLYMGWPVAGSRNLWIAALVSFIAMIAITVVFHLPTNASFVAKAVALEDVPAVLDQWLRLHAARIALGFGAAVLGMLAMVRQITA